MTVSLYVWNGNCNVKMASLLGQMLLTLVSISLWALCAAQDPVNPNMRSFSNAIKSGILVPGVELTLYESYTGEPGVITEQWFTGIKDTKECVECI